MPKWNKKVRKTKATQAASLMSLLWSTLAASSARCKKVLAILTAWDLPRNILPESHSVLSEPSVRETNCDTHILALVVFGNFGVSHRNLTFPLRTPVKPAATAWLTLPISVVSSAHVFPHSVTATGVCLCLSGWIWENTRLSSYFKQQIPPAHTSLSPFNELNFLKSEPPMG